MKQLLQDLSTGAIAVHEVPAPQRGPASLLVATRYSLISAGTERAILELGRASLIGKARARPDRVQQVIDSVRTEGPLATYNKVCGRLGEPATLGYSLAGVVLEACDGAPAGPGDLVACAGAGLASHAEVVSVPRTLCARVPDGVPAQDAAYATVAAIALHGIRLSEARLGDVVTVIGLGLVGRLALQQLIAAGCVPLGLDPDPRRVALAREVGVFASSEPGELEEEALRLTDRRGADAALVTAASKSSAPLAAATAAARERAVVCIVGDVAIESPRAPLFAKELRLVVSRSYGPGRYDPAYEERGIDYPAGYVRWTEGRNLQEVLRLMATGDLTPLRLTTHTFDLDNGADAYALLDGEEHSLGVLLRYSGGAELAADSAPRGRVVALDDGDRRLRGRVRAAARRAHSTRGQISIGVIGAGAFARGVLMPRLARESRIVAVANATGVSARAAATRFGARVAATDPAAVFDSDEVDAVVIATRHDSHARLTVRALEAGKHVFVEKPLALTEEELREVERAAAQSSGVLMVGYNRRFAPLALKLRDALGGHGPLMICYRINAGRLSRSHWTHDPNVGGGRIVGEGCHFVDFAGFLSRGCAEVVAAAAVAGASEPREDNVAATLAYPDGSVAIVVYAALGDPSLNKERVEVLGEHGAGVLDDFSVLHLHRRGETETIARRREKGHAAEIGAFLEACRTGVQPWPVAEMAAVTRATFAIRDALGADARNT